MEEKNKLIKKEPISNNKKIYSNSKTFKPFTKNNYKNSNYKYKNKRHYVTNESLDAKLDLLLKKISLIENKLGIPLDLNLSSSTNPKIEKNINSNIQKDISIDKSKKNINIVKKEKPVSTLPILSKLSNFKKEGTIGPNLHPILDGEELKIDLDDLIPLTPVYGDSIIVEKKKDEITTKIAQRVKRIEKEGILSKQDNDFIVVSDIGIYDVLDIQVSKLGGVAGAEVLFYISEKHQDKVKKVVLKELVRLIEAPKKSKSLQDTPSIKIKESPVKNTIIKSPLPKDKKIDSTNSTSNNKSFSDSFYNTAYNNKDSSNKSNKDNSNIKNISSNLVKTKHNPKNLSNASKLAEKENTTALNVDVIKEEKLSENRNFTLKKYQDRYLDDDDLL